MIFVSLKQCNDSLKIDSRIKFSLVKKKLWTSDNRKFYFFSPTLADLISILDFFSNFSCMFLNLKSNGFNLLDMKNLQEQVKKAFCYQELFWTFTVWINCFGDLKNFANFGPSASNFKSFSWSLEHFFLTVGQNIFENKIPFLTLLNVSKSQV